MASNSISAGRDNRIANLRIFCIILVVLAHSMIIYKDSWNYYSTNTTSQFFNYLCQFIYLFHMPLFFSLSGYLAFYSYQKKPQFKDFIFKKIKRLIIPFLCIGLFYMIPIRYAAQYPNYIQNDLIYNISVNFLLGRDSGHLWFLPTLFLIFVFHFLMMKYLKNEKIVFVVSLLLFASSSFLPTYFGNMAANMIWFHLGYMINALPSSYKNKTMKYASLGFFIIAAMSYFLVPEIAFLKKGIQFVVAFAAIIFLHLSFTDNKCNRALMHVEKNSFGIYLLHSPLLYLMFCFFPDIPPALMVFINFVILGSFALGLSIICRKSKLRFMIGESLHEKR